MDQIPRCKTHNRKMRMSEYEGVGFRPVCDECSLEENWERVRRGEV
jgi:hypothetical protein